MIQAIVLRLEEELLAATSTAVVVLVAQHSCTRAQITSVVLSITSLFLQVSLLRTEWLLHTKAKAMYHTDVGWAVELMLLYTD
jgi:hypothetical protein